MWTRLLVFNQCMPCLKLNLWFFLHILCLWSHVQEIALSQPHFFPFTGLGNVLLYNCATFVFIVVLLKAYVDTRPIDSSK